MLVLYRFNINKATWDLKLLLTFLYQKSQENAAETCKNTAETDAGADHKGSIRKLAHEGREKTTGQVVAHHQIKHF
jgi:hypothetical protein